MTGVNYNSEAADSCYNSEQQLDRNSTNSSADDISDRWEDRLVGWGWTKEVKGLQMKGLGWFFENQLTKFEITLEILQKKTKWMYSLWRS